MNKILPAFIFLVVMFSIFMFSLKDFFISMNDNEFMKACDTHTIRHSGENISFPLGYERHTYEVELSDGKIYKLSEKLYRKIILEGCGYNDENSDNN